MSLQYFTSLTLVCAVTVNTHQRVQADHTQAWGMVVGDMQRQNSYQ